MTETAYNWQVFRGDHVPDGERITHLPPPPPWRQFRIQAEPDTPDAVAYRQTIAGYWSQLQALMAAESNIRDRLRGQSFRVRSDQTNVIQAVNAALALRRPLLITGKPGSGKTSLAYAIAYELQLGPVLMWPITARSTLETGLYRYDAIARLQDAQLRKKKIEEGDETVGPEIPIGDYIQLGPLGTAFLPAPYPRVLLIDEVDKSDINLPNDLLNLLEEGQFEIPELVRLSKQQSAQAEEGLASESESLGTMKVRTADDLEVAIEGGQIRCDAFPLIVMTSNGERDFPPAFLRRCLRVEMPKPVKTDLYEIVKAHLAQTNTDNIDDLVESFLTKTDKEAKRLATDQLLNAVYLRQYGADISPESSLEDLIFAALTSVGVE